MVVVRRPGSRDVLACTLLIAVAAAIGEGSILRRPDLTRGADFLFGDAGFSLLVAREILHGARLYADIAYQYGAAPVYLYCGYALIFGNTPAAYLHFLLAVSLLNLTLFYALARRAAAPGLAFFVSLIGAVPVILVPGGLLGGYLSSYYIPIERALMLGAALLWLPPRQRSPRRAAALGLCLGAMQVVRFGPGVALGAVIVVLDAAVHVVQRGTVRRWIVAESWMLCAAAAVEAARVGVALTVLPRPVALDVVWPAYMLSGFGSIARFPGWHGWAMGIGQYFNPLTAIVLACAAVAWIAAGRARWEPVEDGSQLILPLFFVAGVCGLFRSEHHFYQGAWTLATGAMVALRRWPRIRPLAAVACLPALAIVVAAPLRAPSPSRTVQLHDGWRLTVRPDVADRVEGIAGAVRGSSDRPVLFYPSLGGFSVALDRPLLGREAFFFIGVVRPYEEAALAREYARAGLIVTCRRPEAWTASQGLFEDYFPTLVRQAVEPRATGVAWRDESCRAVWLRQSAAR
jgi:hypothetical protein